MLTAKHVVLGPDELDEITRVLESGDLSGKSTIVEAYEVELAKTFGSKHALACSSGTGAIHLSLMALGVGRGDEVIVPATAAVMTALPCLAVGARLTIVDIASPESFDLDLSDVEAAIGPRTKAVVSVPMWGYASSPNSLAEMCVARGVPLIEDAAQAHGSMVAGRHLGTFGDIGCFSTHMRKLVTTGEGGFCLTRDPALHERLYAVRTLGQGPDGPGSEDFGTRFGLNFKLSGVAAAVGLPQLRRLPDRLEARNRVAARWTEVLADCPHVKLLDRPVVHNCYGFAILVPPASKGTVEDNLVSVGILTDTRAYRYRLLHEHELFEAFRRPAPNADDMLSRLVVLPCHEAIPDEAILRAGAQIRTST